MDLTKRIKMHVVIEATIPQALALQAMFEYWNALASWGSSRYVSFYVDGDGNFKPNCQIGFSQEIPKLTKEMKRIAVVGNERDGDYVFDFDPISCLLNEEKNER